MGCNSHWTVQIGGFSVFPLWQEPFLTFMHYRDL